MKLPRVPFWILIITALLAGIAFGFVLHPDSNIIGKEHLKNISPWLRLPGDIFLNLLQMIMIPLVITSISLGVASLGSTKNFWNLGIRTFAYFIFTTSVAVCLGILLTVLIQPGIGVMEVSTTAQIESLNVQSLDSTNSFSKSISDLIPKNLINAFANQQMISLVIFGILLGIFFLSNTEGVASLKSFAVGLEKFCLWIVSLAMYIAPFAVFGLIATAVVQIGSSVLSALSLYVLTVLLGLVLLFCFYLLLVRFLGGMNPFLFLSLIREIPVLGFSTSSSSSVLPYSIKVAKEKLQLEATVANFVLPLGATVNMDGTALYQAVASVFLSQIYAVPLSTFDLFLLVVTVTTASIGTAATPGVGLVILASILSAFQIPVEGITILFGVDRFLDMCRTSVNLTGDLTCATIMNQKWKENGNS